MPVQPGRLDMPRVEPATTEPTGDDGQRDHARHHVQQVQPGDAEERRPKQHRAARGVPRQRSEEHTSELQSLRHLVCRLLLEKKNYIVRHELEKILASAMKLE